MVVALERALPRQILIEAQIVALARLLETHETVLHRCNYPPFVASDQALGAPSRQIGQRNSFAVWPDAVGRSLPIVMV